MSNAGLGRIAFEKIFIIALDQFQIAKDPKP